ncbi:MAG: hypothetical protein C0453_02810 [Comamonadaceae bacterium]|nr:hypothetical protein [Comamonadaceae bacterium]
MLGKGAAAGAAVGLSLDIALAGLSLGTGTALGAAIGGVVGQGWGQLPRKLRNRMMRIEELTLQDDVLAVLADGLLQLCQRLQARGHAALEPLAVRLAPGDNYRTDLQALLKDLAPARSHPEWERAHASAAVTDGRREVVRERVAERFERLLGMIDVA